MQHPVGDRRVEIFATDGSFGRVGCRDDGDGIFQFVLSDKAFLQDTQHGFADGRGGGGQFVEEKQRLLGFVESDSPSGWGVDDLAVDLNGKAEVVRGLADRTDDDLTETTPRGGVGRNFGGLGLSRLTPNEGGDIGAD